MKRKPDRTMLLFSAAGLASSLFLSFAEVKPNRILSGTRLSSMAYFGAGAGLLLLLWAVFVLLSFYRESPAKHRIAMALSSVLLVALLVLTGLSATVQVSGGSSAARVSLQSGTYVSLVCLYILFSTAMGKLKGNRGFKFVLILLVTVSLGLAFYFSLFDSLSIMKEYQVKRAQFSSNLSIHLFLAVGAVVSALLIAVPLGYLAYRKPRLESRIMVPLSILETIPSLSLFGILLVPLATVGNIAIFRSLGIRGIGWAPAYVALTLYALLPIGRNALVGFKNVDRGIIEAARGMGMSRWNILERIEAPLAFPVIFTGIRIALVQALGGAVLAGLVGGGGLGSFVFLGLAEASSDLILLGVIPIVVLTMASDGILKFIAGRLQAGGMTS